MKHNFPKYHFTRHDRKLLRVKTFFRINLRKGNCLKLGKILTTFQDFRHSSIFSTIYERCRKYDFTSIKTYDKIWSKNNQIKQGSGIVQTSERSSHWYFNINDNLSEVSSLIGGKLDAAWWGNQWFSICRHMPNNHFDVKLLASINIKTTIYENIYTNLRIFTNLQVY